MKIFNWIDSLFDTRRKRVLWLIVLAAIYWFWTDVWEILFFSKLTSLSGYESLFEFLQVMDRYDKTLLIRIIYSVVSNAQLTFKGILQSISLMDLLLLMATGLVFCQEEMKIHKKLLLMTEGIFLIGLMIFLLMGFQAGTLAGVIGILRYIGIFGIIMKLIQAGIILFDLIKNINDYIF